MNTTVNTARRCAVRRALLASTGVAALSQVMTGAYAQTVVEETAVELTRRSDTRTLTDVTLDVQESTNLLGVTPDVIAIGVDGDYGLTLTGAGDVRGLVEKNNYFGLLDGLTELVSYFTDADNITEISVFGVEGGYGANTLKLEGDLVVDAASSVIQDGVDLLTSADAGDTPTPFSLRAGAAANALGFTSTRGRSTTTNSGELIVGSLSEFARTNFNIDVAGLDVISSLRTSDTLSIGLAGDRYTDRLTNDLGGVVTTDATAEITLTGIALQGVKLGAVPDASQASATSTAMDGGQGNDILVNQGALTANSTSKLLETDIAVVVKELSPPSSLLPDAEENSFSLAVATGMDGGLGADQVTNNGAIDLSAFADFNQVGIGLSDGGISSDAIVTVIDHFGAEESEENLREGAIAEVVGLRGDARGVAGGGADKLNNTGRITGVATADSDVVSISVGVPLSEQFDAKKVGGASKALTAAHVALSVFGIGLLDYSSDAAAFADGVRGGAGNDDIDNSGEIDVTANSTSNTVGVSVSGLDAGADSGDGPDEPLSINATVLNASANAVSHSVGLAGGDEDDAIDNDGSVTSRADARAGNVEVTASLAIEDKALQIEVPIIFSQTSATAQADGIDAGDGFDTVNNNGDLTSIADATATSADVTVGVSIVSGGGGINAAIIDKDIVATSAATGIRDGLGTDTVNNAGDITATATSTAGSTSVGVDVAVNTTGISVASGLANAAQTATSRAFGVERILDDRDSDASFTSTGEIDATATATSTRTGVSVDLAYANTGLSIAAPIISANNTADADAGALISFEADDVFSGLADMTAAADATATSTGVGVSGAVSLIGVGAGVSVLKSSTISDADATLLSFGTGADTVANGSILLADADAVSRATDVSVGVGGTTKGLAIGGALVESTTDAIAKATTIATGDDDDVVVNEHAALWAGEGAGDGIGEIKADAFADANSTGVGVAVSAVVGTPENPGVGVGLAAALSRAGVLGDADAVAVDLGAGEDHLTNTDKISAIAEGKARNETVNVALSGSMVGAAVSGAIADTSVDADANATGAEGGADAAELYNSGTLVSDATADANTVGVAASGSIAAGFAAGAAALLADTTADAMALGMNGGEGEDTVENSGEMTVDSDADAANASIAVNINATPSGVSVGAAVVSARTNAYSDAVGLSGDAEGLTEDDEPTLLASENDTVRNSDGSLTVTSRADASTVSVGVNGQYFGLGAVAIVADTISDSSAIGMFGGSGADVLFNEATITTTANAFANGPSVAINPIGANIGNVNTEASAFSFGLDGGVGDDNLFNTGSITSNANSTVSGELVQVTLIGGTLGDLSTKSNSTAFGLFGGEGHDGLLSTGVINTASTATVTGTSVAVDLVGASFADVTTQATAIAAGLSGGAGANIFDVAGTINATATANARSTNVAVVLAGAAFADSADASTKGTAKSYGYLGGDDADTGVLGGAATVKSFADARNDGASASVAGASFTKTAPEAIAFASVFGGGDGDDNATHSGIGIVTADADTIAGGTAVSLIGASSANADPHAKATAYGLSGDGGVDTLLNTGSLTTTADADVDVGRYRVTLAGASIGSVSSTSEATAAGIAGGADTDSLSNAGTLTSNAYAKLDSDGVDVSFVGANVDTASGDQLATASARGIRGGEGGDVLSNAGSIVSNTVITGSAGQVGVTVAGAGLVDAKTILDAVSIGLDGEADGDTITNNGAITSTSTVNGDNTNTSVVLAGASKGDTSANSKARSLLIEGGAGDDNIFNNNAGTSTATSKGSAFNVEVTVGGALLGKAESITSAEANGLSGGDGDDYVSNAAALDLNATATGKVGRTSVAVAGSDGGASLESDVVASAIGVSGGEGEDGLENNALVDIDLSSKTTANSASRVIAGASKVNAGLYSTIDGIGLDGGEDDDEIVNGLLGDLDIRGAATIEANSSSFNIAGVSAVNGLMRSRGNSTGIAGGAGDDDLYNFGEIYLNIDGIASASGSTFTLAGSAVSGGDVKGTTNVFAMDGGDGDDMLFNSGTIYARSDARGTFGSGSYSLAGYSGSGGAVGATSTTTGLFGGAGFDDIFVDGTVTSIADARLTVNSNVNVTFGASSTSRSPLGAEAYGRGVNGGDDDDLIEIAGTLNTYGYSQISMSNTKFAAVGSASGENSATARSEAYGVLGGVGNDVLRNDGVMLVDAESKTTGSGSAGAAIGTTSSAAEVVARANAIGLYGGAGIDTLINTGTITGQVTNTTKSANTVSSYAIFSSGQAKSTSRNYGYGTLFYDSQEDTVVINEGTAKLTYYGDRGSLRGLARSEATANGVTAGVGTDAHAESRSYSYVNLRGVRLGDGAHTVINNRRIELISYATSSASATGNGKSAINGHATGIARAYANGGVLTGVESLTGSLNFINNWYLSVMNKPKAASAAYANATGVSFIDPDARATSTSYLDDVTAYGVRSGDAADTIENYRTITVRSQPEINRALARSKSGGGYSFSVDSFSDAYARANNATAYGIHAGDGDNFVLNNGTITAVSDPYAKASAESTGHGRDGDVWSRARAYAQNATAYGIVTGEGDDTIINNGTITVSATPSVSTTTVASRGSYCYISTPALIIGGKVIIPAVRVCEYGEVDKNEKASSTSGKVTVGISSGGGDDVVTNNGTISASGGTAISLGSGNDTLIVGEGASFVGAISAGSGSDTLHFVGNHSWNASGQSFENFFKSGAGTATLSNAGTLGGETKVFEGVLRISGGASMNNNSRVTTSIFGDGRIGQLSSTSTMAVDGWLTVVADNGVYTDGAVYDVVRGSTRSGAFDTIDRPSATALRDFSGAYTSNSYRVTANVAPVASLMSGSGATASSFAAALDGATAFAEGGVATTLSVLQSLPEEEQVRSAVEDISPELSTGNVKMASASLDASSTATQQRLTSFRAGKVNRATQHALGFDFSEGQKSTKGATSWAANFQGASAAPAFASGFSGDVAGMARGLDFETKSGALLGVSMAHLQGNGTLDAISSSAGFVSTTTTLYGAAPLGDAGYATGSLSWGTTDITGGQPIYGNGATDYGAFERSSQALGVSLEAGKVFRNAPGAPEMFGALNYQTVKGAAFALNKVSDLSLNVEKGQATQLESEFGVRMIKEMNIRGSNLRPHLSLSWVHRYGEGESVSASFADMPDYEFRLLGQRENRDAFRAQAGFNLLSGPRYELTASGVSEFGAERDEARGELRAVVKF